MRYFLAFLFLTSMAQVAKGAQATIGNQTPEVVEGVESDLRAEAQQYLEGHSTEVDGVKWMKWWKDTSDQMQRDNPSMSGEAQAANKFLFDYVADRRKKLKPKEPVKLTDDEKVCLCRFYLLYKLRSWDLPEKLKPMVTKEHYDYIFNGKPLPEKAPAKAEKAK